MSTKDTNVFEGFFYPKVTKAAELGNTPTPQSEMDDPSAQKEYKGCGCETCKELNVDCPDCPVCSAKKADMPASCDCPDCQGNCDCGDCIQCGTDKFGKSVCCPVKKTTKSLWGGNFNPLM